MSLLHKRCFCVVTGASRGIGKAIAEAVAKNLGQKSVLVLLSRNTAALSDVKRTILESGDVQDIQVIYRSFDQGSTDQHVFEGLFPDVLSEAKLSPGDFEQAMIFHNAGTLEILKYCHGLSSMQQNTDYFRTNLAGMVTLNSHFLTEFKSLANVVINISSLAAIKPFKSWAMYCSVKAGRDHFFNVLAEEEPNIRVLNYAPGPIDTNMIQNAIDNTEDTEVREGFIAMKNESKFLTPEMTVQRLIQILEKNQFESAAHIDYFDDL